MNLPKASELTVDDSNQDRRPKLRIIKVKKKKNIGEVDLNEVKRKKVNNWKVKKDGLKKMMNIDMLMTREKKVYDENRTVPRELHELHTENTDDELFLKIESGSVSTINSAMSTRSKLESKLKNTKDKYMKYQTKAINKIKSFIPLSKSNENLKFMTASDIGKSRTLIADSAVRSTNKMNKRPPRPPMPKNYHLNKVVTKLDTLPIADKPPIRPQRKKSKKSLSSLNSSMNAVKTSLPASVYYRQLRERWLEKNGSKSNLSSIYSTSIANCSDRKFSLTANQLGDDFRYRYRADFHQSNQVLNNASSAAEKQSIKSEPNYTIADGLPPKAPLRKRLTVSSYLSGSSFSLHRKLNSDYFNSNTDRGEQAVDPLFWKPFSYKTNRVRSLTALYIRKNESPMNSNPDLDRRIDELNKIYCMPKRPPLPVRFKERHINNPSSESIYPPDVNQLSSNNYLRPNKYTNLHEVYTVRDAIVGPNSISYEEKEIQTSLEDFHDLDYDDEYDTSPRFIDSSINNEFESLADTRNLSNSSDLRIKKQLERNLEDLNLLNELKKQQVKLQRELDAEIRQREFKNEFYEKQVQQNDRTNSSEKSQQSFDDETTLRDDQETKCNQSTEQVQSAINVQTIDKSIADDEITLNDEYVTVQDTSRTVSSYLDAKQGTQAATEERKESTYVTLDYEAGDRFDTDTLADLDSLADASLTAGYVTPMNDNSSSSLNNTIQKSRPKRTRRRNRLSNSGLDTEDEDEITDEIIGIAHNLQKELKQLVEKQN